MTYNWLKSIIALALGTLLKIISPEVRSALSDAINSLYKKAKNTENPWDDFFVEFLAEILNVKIEDK